MEYIKIDKQAYKIHFIKTDKFKKVKIRINFKEKTTKEKVVYRNMLSLVLLEATKKFNTRRLLDIECENLYNIGVGAGTSNSGNYHLLRFNTTFLNEKYTEKGMMEESFKFFLEFIFNPNVIDGKFESQTFNNAKNILKEDIESYADNPGRFAFSRIYEIMCPNSVIKYRSTGYIEDLEKVTEENLYEYYKELLTNNEIDIFIIGNIDVKQMEKIIADNFNIDSIKHEQLAHIVKQDDFRTEPRIIKENKNINQSILILGSKLKDITEFERKYVLVLYNYILGGSADSKLFKEVREKNSLCYSISSTHSGIANLEFISAGIDKENYDKAVELIKAEIKNMEDGNFTEEDINQAKITFLASLKEIEDTANGIINIYEAHEYLDYDLLEERAKEIEKVTKEDIINVSKKMYLDTIYLLEGDKKDA
ncbi:MAG: insulinase family protein [Bacilli bacterium]|nr:insulinase family protein [Bacilli bacterium]